MNINLTLLGQAIAMAVFVWFCMKYVWPPLVQIIEERQQQIADGLAAADKGARSFEEAQTRIATLVEEARGQVAAVAVAGAEKILAREIDARAHQDLLDKLVAQI